MADASKFDHELLLAAVEGELTAPQRKQVEQMITEDSRVGKLLEAMRADRQALRAMPDPAAPHWLMDEIDRQLERDMLVGAGVPDAQVDRVREAHVFRRLMVYGAVAAMLAIVATVILSSLSTPTVDPLGGSVVIDDDPKAPDVPVRPDGPPDAPRVDDPGAGGPGTELVDGSTDQPPVTPIVDDTPQPISIDDALASAADAARDPQLLTQLVVGEGRGAPSVDEALNSTLAEGGTLPRVDDPGFAPPLSGDTPNGPRIDGLINDPDLPGPTPTPPTPDDPSDPNSFVSPGDQAPIDEMTRPVFRVQDRDATLKRIDRLAEQFEGVRVPGASDAPGTVVYRVSADRLQGFISAMSDAVGEDENLELDRAVSQLPKLDDSPWPSLAPDYLSILNQQFAGEDEKAEPAKIDLPVKVIQQRSSE